MRIIHLSDIHVWRYAFNPLRLFNKRAVGMVELLTGRARKFRLDRLDEVVARVDGLEADHILISGDLTTTALPEEFRAAYARDMEAQRRSEAERMYGEDQRRWDVEQQNRARELAAAEEERAFARRLIEEREGRKHQARLRLSDFLGRGR